MSSNLYRHHHRVTYAECTIGNHVYYARYLDILEEVRGEFFRSMGAPLLNLREQDAAFPVVECHLKYSFPARYDDELDIEVWVTNLENVRIGLGYRVANQSGKLVVAGSTMHACTTLAGVPRRLPVQLRDALARYLSPTPPPPR